MKRNHKFEIKVSKEEKEQLERKSNMLGLTLASFVRMVALKSNVEIENN